MMVLVTNVDVPYTILSRSDGIIIPQASSDLEGQGKGYLIEYISWKSPGYPQVSAMQGSFFRLNQVGIILF